jgi:hypothetical protein
MTEGIAITVDMMRQDAARSGCQQTGRGAQGTRVGRRARMNTEYETARTGRGLSGVRETLHTNGRGAADSCKNNYFET